jgi:hypothetical protein
MLQLVILIDGRTSPIHNQADYSHSLPSYPSIPQWLSHKLPS